MHYQWKNDPFSNRYIRNNPKNDIEKIFAEHEAEKEAQAILAKYEGEEVFKNALLAKLAQRYVGKSDNSNRDDTEQ